MKVSPYENCFDNLFPEFALLQYYFFNLTFSTALQHVVSLNFINYKNLVLLKFEFLKFCLVNILHTEVQPTN